MGVNSALAAWGGYAELPLRHLRGRLDAAERGVI